MASCASQDSVVTSNSIRIAIVVGEASGDLLGASLMNALRVHYPNAIFEGIGGPEMLAQGFQSFFAQDRLAVMGLVEPLARLPELLSIRSNLRKRFIADPPSVFIGIDSPDFNLDLELALKKCNIPTVHYVSPSVWAWRQGRIKKIAKAVDLMLTLLPFEAAFYEKHKVSVKFVGHPLADKIPLEPNAAKAIDDLGISEFAAGKKIVALMPGSRASEVERMGELFLNVAEYCISKNQNVVFLIPSANPKRHQQIQVLLEARLRNLPIKLIEGRSHLVMEASDVVVMASGTTTLETMLYKKPMVIAYKVAGFSYWLFKKLVKVKFIGLPNLLAQKALVPEFIQHEATVQSIADVTLQYLANPIKSDELVKEFAKQHLLLRQNASEQAAMAISQLVTIRSGKPCK